MHYQFNLPAMLSVFLCFCWSPDQLLATETFSRDTLFASTGEAIAGEIVGFDNVSITITNRAALNSPRTFRLNQIDSVSCRSWTLLKTDGSIIECNHITFHPDLTFSLCTHPQDTLTIADIGAIYISKSSIAKKCNGAALGSLAGAIVSSVVTSKLRTTEFDGESEFLSSINPFAVIAGGLWGRKRAGQNLELQTLYINPTFVGTFDYKSGWEAGMRAPSGNLQWVLNGLALNLIAPIYALKYKPVPALNSLAGNPSAYMVGYIEGYGDKAKLKNVVFSTIGVAGNSMLVVAIVVGAAIGGDPNFTN